nr:hypothetical protein Itr_chr07CG07370 [Ipomoea trifida]
MKNRKPSKKFYGTIGSCLRSWSLTSLCCPFLSGHGSPQLASRFVSGGWSPYAGRSRHVQGLWSRNNRTRVVAYGFGLRVEFNRLTFVHCGRGKVGAIPMFSNRQLDIFTVLTVNPHLSLKFTVNIAYRARCGKPNIIR